MMVLQEENESLKRETRQLKEEKTNLKANAKEMAAEHLLFLNERDVEISKLQSMHAILEQHSAETADELKCVEIENERLHWEVKK